MKIKLVSVGAEQASMTCAKGGESEKIDYNEAQKRLFIIASRWQR